MAIRLGLTGDVMLGRLVDRRYRRRSIDGLWGDMLETLQELDGLLINLECAIAKGGTPWRRTTRAFLFRADPTWAIPALQAAGVDACTLANNHILDFEVGGLQETIDHLDDAAIAHTGAGNTLLEALQPARFDVNDTTVAAIGLTDNTPEYAATEDTPGTAHITIDVENNETRERVRRALSNAQAVDPDVLVASLHWGPNMRVHPPEAFRTFARWLIDNGVDIIHGHSAHVVQGIEIYDGRPILYDTGDFVDDYAVDDDLRNDRSILTTVVIENGDIDRLELTPVEIAECAVHQAQGETVDWIHDTIRERSATFDTTFTRHGDDLIVEFA